MDTLLPRDLEELVKRKVEAGAYELASDMAALLPVLAARDGHLTLRDARDETSELGTVDRCVFGGGKQYVLCAM